MSAISSELIAAYRATHYRVGAGPDAFTLRIDEHSESLARLYETFGWQCAAFVTAYNPCSRPQSADVNLAAHARLRDELTQRDATIIEGAAVDPAGGWEEQSVLALGLDADAAKTIGLTFRQNAIVWAGPDANPRLILLR